MDKDSFWFKIFFLFLLFFSHDLKAAFAPVRPNYNKTGPNIRIRVEKNLPQFSVSGLDIERTLHRSKNKAFFGGVKKIVFNCYGALKKMSSLPKKKLLLASIQSPTGFISLMKDRYKGKLLVFSSLKKKGCDVIHDTFMESYISSLLAKEMNESWPIEALKAQAIAARGYAYEMLLKSGMSLKRKAFHLDSSEVHQVSGDFFDITKKTYDATLATKGMVLTTQKGKIIPSFYHAKCGGKTLNPKYVWGNSIEGYVSKKCPFCQHHGKRGWTSFISKKKIYNFLSHLKKKKRKIKTKKKLRIVPHKYEDLSIRFYVGDKLYVVEKVKIRRYFGRKILPSHYFVGKIKSKGVSIKGKGRGHGVGMCQIGALDLAQRGWGYKKILKYYYPKHFIKRAY
jgi:stage II sporulation protein D